MLGVTSLWPKPSSSLCHKISPFCPSKTEQMPIRSGKHFSLVIQNSHIRITRRGKKTRLQFRAPNFNSRSDLDRGDFSIAANIQMLCHGRIVLPSLRCGDYKSSRPLQSASFQSLLSSSQGSQPLPSIGKPKSPSPNAPNPNTSPPASAILPAEASLYVRRKNDIYSISNEARTSAPHRDCRRRQGHGDDSCLARP